MSNQATNCETCHKNPCQCRPTYPHTEWLNKLRPAASEAFLSESELLGFVEALLLEYMKETLIPEITSLVEYGEGMDSVADRSSGSYLRANMEKAKICAENIALGLSNDIGQIMERNSLVLGITKGIRLQ